MRNSARRERSREFVVRVEQLTPEKRGELVLFLFGHALMMCALQSWWLALLFRTALAVRRQGDYRPGPALRTAWSPGLGVATALVVARQLSNPLSARRLDRWVSEKSADRGD